MAIDYEEAQREFNLTVKNFRLIVANIDLAGTITYKQSKFNEFNENLRERPLAIQRKVITHIVNKYFYYKLIAEGYEKHSSKDICEQIASNWLSLLKNNQYINFVDLYRQAENEAEVLQTHICRIDYNLPLSKQKQIAKAVIKLATLGGILSIDTGAIFFGADKELFVPSFWSLPVLFCDGITDFPN